MNIIVNFYIKEIFKRVDGKEINERYEMKKNFKINNVRIINAVMSVSSLKREDVIKHVYDFLDDMDTPINDIIVDCVLEFFRKNILSKYVFSYIDNWITKHHMKNWKVI